MEIMYIMHAATEYAPTCSIGMHQHVAKFMQGYISVLFEVSLSGRMSGEYILIYRILLNF